MVSLGKLNPDKLLEEKCMKAMSDMKIYTVPADSFVPVISFESLVLSFTLLQSNEKLQLRKESKKKYKSWEENRVFRWWQIPLKNPYIQSYNVAPWAHMSQASRVSTSLSLSLLSICKRQCVI